MELLPKVKILLVDDRQENLISLAAVLESPGYELFQAQSGQEALRFLLDHEFALILMDVQMPVMDGFETAQLIKSREKTRDVPIIFVTAINKDEPFVFQGYGAGAVDYIMKPFDPHVLRSKVGVFAELYRKSIQLKDQEVARVEFESLKREQAANQKYRDLVEGIENGIVWTARADSLQFDFVSPRAVDLLGFSLDDWLQTKAFWTTCSYPEDLERVVFILRNGFDETSGEQSFEHRMVSKEGQILWFQTSVRISTSEDGHREIRGLSVNVTSLKEAEESARLAVRSRDEFLSIASHELKTPLTSLKLQLGIYRRIENKDLTPDEYREKTRHILHHADRQVNRLTRLVDELLDVSRINNGKLELHPEAFDLSDLILEICSRFSDESQRIGCEMEHEVDTSVRGSWDRLRVDQVVTNLLTNALKYGDSQPVKVSLKQEGDWAVIRVRDHGIGIAEEDQARIFNRFERAVSSGNYGGIGLGLYIVQQIVRQHGGSIGVQSQKGLGSTFTVRLPLENALNAAADADSRGLSRDSASSGETIRSDGTRSH